MKLTLSLHFFELKCLGAFYISKLLLLKIPRFNILRYQDSVLYWTKVYLKSQQFLDKFLQVHYFQLNEFHLCQQPYQIGEALLFSRIVYCLQQTFHLDFHNIFFLFFLKERRKNFFEIFRNLVRVIIAFDDSFLKRGIWIPQACFFLCGACLFKASRFMWQNL